MSSESVHRALPFMLLGCLANILAFLTILIASMHHHPYQTLFVATLAHICAGWLNFATVIVYMASLAKEVGNKMYKSRAEMDDDALFHYAYGFSFILLKVSFFATQAAALLAVLVYMSKMDERTYNRYQMSSMLKGVRQETGMDALMEQNRLYRRHSRVVHLQHGHQGVPKVRCMSRPATVEEEVEDESGEAVDTMGTGDASSVGFI